MERSKKYRPYQKQNKIIDNGEAIANTFNDFFTEIGKNLAEKIPQPTVFLLRRQ